MIEYSEKKKLPIGAQLGSLSDDIQKAVRPQCPSWSSMEFPLKEIKKSIGLDNKIDAGVLKKYVNHIRHISLGLCTKYYENKNKFGFTNSNKIEDGNIFYNVFYDAQSILESIDEKINKRPASEIPETLINVNNHIDKNTKSISPAVRHTVEEYLKNLFITKDFCTKVPDNKNILASIAKDRFKNQFETGTSRGHLDNTNRLKLSKKIFGWTSNNIAGENLEKYGFLGGLGEDIVSIYGNITFTFKKEKVKNRTTFTCGDSLVNNLFAGAGSSCIASKVTNPKIESIPGVIERNYINLEKIYSTIRGLNVDPPLDILNFAKGHSLIELQYHGRLTLDDVDKIDVDIMVPSKKFHILAKIFEPANIPIHYGSMLYDPDNSPVFDIV